MKPLRAAAKDFIKCPRENYSKICPYLRSKFTQIRRELLEKCSVDRYSKPYPGHVELIKYLNFKNGYFVVCGANDGVLADPTYYYEKFLGWTGLMIEPLPRASTYCRQNRPNSKVIEVALVSNDYKGDTIKIIDCNAMSVTENSRLDKKQWVQQGEKAENIQSQELIVAAKTLDAVIEQHTDNRKIDLLVIDVEGSEVDVLNGFSIKKHKPDYILIEIQSKEIEMQVRETIDRDYSFVSRIGPADHLYVAK